MKLVVIKSNLKDNLSALEKTSGDGGNLPILKNFLIEAEGNKIKITTTNLEVGVECLIPGKVIENGKLTTPINLFLNIINNLQTERLNIESKDNNIIIKTDNYNATIQGLPVDEFPIIPKIKNQKESIKIKSDIFKEFISQVVVATQFSDLRPELNSVLFDFSIDDIKLVATDSFRLAEKTIGKNQFESTYKEGFKVLIPIKTIQEISRVFRDDEVVEIYNDNNQILFKSDRLSFISRLIDGNFPEYANIIPKKFNSEIILKREEFINALKLAGVFGSRVSEVKIKIHDNKKAIEIFSSDQGFGENKYLLPAKITGEFKEVAFNWRYLLDGLKILKTEEVYFGINEDNKPAVLKSPSLSSYFYILMPILKT